MRYAIGAFLVFVAWAVTFTLKTSVHAPTFQTPFFVCAIVLSSWIGGFGPGILATVLSIFAVEYCLTLPLFTRAGLAQRSAEICGVSSSPELSSAGWPAGNGAMRKRCCGPGRSSRRRCRSGRPTSRSRYEKLTAEITERARAEKELHRINRVWRVRSICNRAIMRSANESELLKRVCQTFIQAGGYRVAWVRYASSRLRRPRGACRPLQHTGSHPRVGYGRMRRRIVAGGNSGWQTDPLQWSTWQIRAPSLKSNGRMQTRSKLC